MRRALLLSALVLAVSCGGSPMAPSTTTSGTPQPTSSLASGAYLLTVSMATSGNSGFSSCISSGINGTPGFSAVVVPMPVKLERTGNAVTITPDDSAATFRMQLQVAGASLSGSASGQFTTSATLVTVSGGFSGGLASATGVVGPTSVYGAIDGTISVQGTSCTNNGHSWLLVSR